MTARDHYAPIIAQSTIDAAIYLICFAPERLRAWASARSDGREIVGAAQHQIEIKRQRNGRSPSPSTVLTRVDQEQQHESSRE